MNSSHLPNMLPDSLFVTHTQLSMYFLCNTDKHKDQTLKISDVIHLTMRS